MLLSDELIVVHRAVAHFSDPQFSLPFGDDGDRSGLTHREMMFLVSNPSGAASFFCVRESDAFLADRNSPKRLLSVM
jgi:hypothetical protein